MVKLGFLPRPRRGERGSPWTFEGSLARF